MVPVVECNYVYKIKDEQTTWARISLIYSLQSASPWPSIRMSLSARICKNGSVMPPMSYSGAYELLDTSLSIRTSPSRQFCHKKALSEHLLTQMKMQVHNDLDSIIQQQCQKKSTIRQKRRKFALLVQITTKGTVAYTKKRSHYCINVYSGTFC
jgi:hypothetical protein